MSSTHAHRRSQSAWGALMSDLNRHYRLHLSRRSRSAAQVGMKTQHERRIVIERALLDLHCDEYELRKLKNLRSKHVRAIIDKWRGRGLKASTLATNISHLRTLCRWIQKPELTRVIDGIIAAEPELTRRRVATDRDRSERGSGVELGDILARAFALDPRFCCQLALIAAFGLRALESWLFRPHLAEDAAGRVHILWGTKGGRPRTLPLPMTDEQRLALDWARSFAATDAESMIPRGWKLQQWRRRFYRLCARVGLTKRATGATPHSFRHGVLLDLYKRLTGSEAPARGGDLKARDPYADEAARALVAALAGHSRLSVSSAYLGSATLSRALPTTAVTEPAPNTVPKAEPHSDS
ncbi:MAG: integrase domain-containing protein [Steroidobacteraceae bacterium]